MLDRSDDEVLTAVTSGWERWTDPTTSLRELVDGLGLTMPPLADEVRAEFGDEATVDDLDQALRDTPLPPAELGADGVADHADEDALAAASVGLPVTPRRRVRRRARLAWLGVLVVVVACSPAQVAEDDDGRTEDTAAPEAVPSEGSPSREPDGGPEATPLTGFDGWRDLDVAGQGRRVRVIVPEGLPADAPVVVGLHGRGAGPEHLLEQSQLQVAAAERGFALALPEARGQRWQVTGGDDDVALVVAAVADLAELGHVGGGGVHLVGFSQGGSMALRVAADRPELAAAVATVAAQLPLEITPTEGVPALLIHGASDPLRPLSGLSAAQAGEGDDAPDPTRSSSASADALARAAGAEGDPLAAPLDDGSPVLRCTYGGAVPVVLLVVGDGGHTWPGTTYVTSEDRFGPTSQAFDATTVVLDFLLDATIPGATTAVEGSADATCGTS